MFWVIHEIMARFGFFDSFVFLMGSVRVFCFIKRGSIPNEESNQQLLLSLNFELFNKHSILFYQF
jgi:hypothetical protein